MTFLCVSHVPISTTAKAATSDARQTTRRERHGDYSDIGSISNTAGTARLDRGILGFVKVHSYLAMEEKTAIGDRLPDRPPSSDSRGDHSSTANSHYHSTSSLKWADSLTTDDGRRAMITA